MSPKGLLLIIVLLLLFYDEVIAKSKSSFRSSNRGGHVKPFSRSKPKYYSGRSNLFSRRSGLSNSRKKALFFTAGALAGVYIGSRMRTHVHVRSYHDLYKYEVCEGRRTEFINETDDPNQPFEKYCCWDSSTGMGVCCSYDVKVSSTSGRGTVVGALFGILFLASIIGLIIFCCCRRKRRPIMEPADIPNAQPIPPVDAFYKPNQYPASYPNSSVPYPVNPYPPPGQGLIYFQNSNSYPSVQPVLPVDGTVQIGSGWGADSDLSTSAVRPNYPPPPYPGYPTSNNPTVDPSAPSSGLMTKS
ncbi:unnamed protein product [Heterobilharzia americana]|nr:unnamed protein product [Heterobilharzia americana]